MVIVSALVQFACLSTASQKVSIHHAWPTCRDASSRGQHQECRRRRRCREILSIDCVAATLMFPFNCFCCVLFCYSIDEWIHVELQKKKNEENRIFNWNMLHGFASTVNVQKCREKQKPSEWWTKLNNTSIRIAWKVEKKLKVDRCVFSVLSKFISM